jgi:hypothetical protein
MSHSVLLTPAKTFVPEVQIENRLARLERSNRNLRWGLFVIALVGAFVLIWRSNDRVVAQAPAKETKLDVLTVNRLNFVGRSGRVTAFLFGGDDPMFHIVGGATLTKESFTLDDGEGRLFLEPSRIRLGRRTGTQLKADERLQRLIDAGEKKAWEVNKSLPEPALVLSADERGGGMISVYNSFSKEVISMQANKGNTGAVYVSDVNGDVRGQLIGGP